MVIQLNSRVGFQFQVEPRRVWVWGLGLPYGPSDCKHDGHEKRILYESNEGNLKCPITVKDSEDACTSSS